MIVSAALLLAGAAINAVGIRNPTPEEQTRAAETAPAAG
jgi:hypothetical protein